MITIPKRRFSIDIDGKVFEAKELSARYLMDAAQNPDSDTIESAISDSMTLTDDDYKLFGKDTLEQLYIEIVKFTFKETVAAKDLNSIKETFNFTDEDLAYLSTDAKVQLSMLIKKKNEPPNTGKV